MNRGTSNIEHPMKEQNSSPFHEPDVHPQVFGSARTCPRIVSTRHVASRKAATCRRTPRRCRGNWFMVPMHAKNRKEALHESGKRPPHPIPLPQGGEGTRRAMCGRFKFQRRSRKLRMAAQGFPGGRSQGRPPIDRPSEWFGAVRPFRALQPPAVQRLIQQLQLVGCHGGFLLESGRMPDAYKKTAQQQGRPGQRAAGEGGQRAGTLRVKLAEQAGEQ